MLSDLLVDFYITFLFPVVKYILVHVIISIEGPSGNGSNVPSRFLKNISTKKGKESLPSNSITLIIFLGNLKIQ